MTSLLHNLIRDAAGRTPDAPALQFRDTVRSYRALWESVSAVAAQLHGLGLAPDDRVAIYLPKQFETVQGFFGVLLAGGVFVPVNPVLKPAQVAHILADCDVRVLVSSADRINALAGVLDDCPDLRHLLVVGDKQPTPQAVADRGVHALATHDAAAAAGADRALPRRVDNDLAAILYTSGSTGRPKGVVLSHRNMVAGALSVSEYLGNHATDRLLAVLPFSFDYGLSQLTTAFAVGACVVLMDYLMPRDVIRAVDRFAITGLAAVPPLWNQLAQLEWPDPARQTLRYITNSGGAMPVATTQGLRAQLPATAVYLMYGLTEAFRSTYLDPAQVDTRPESMGKAIPNAEILVVRPDGSECDPDEVGELVHRGAHVAQGYWNAPEKTAQRFRPAPGRPAGIMVPEIAVWSGDFVRRDGEGYLYFVGRRDEMIKTSGYRVSPAEIEEVVFELEAVAQAVALGVAHPTLGQGVVLVVQLREAVIDVDHIGAHCRTRLPQFMHPGHIAISDDLPRNANGKIDRKLLGERFAAAFNPTEDA